ncbi:MAG: tyrosine-type recombinase/integrase [Polyangiaceae bacterium]|nr:tyrosine-type recombinase/integrase [Polyangiaceae bacterium]MCE7890385.1 hypothetical protein [Sorangiineae bacterium PRO1]MCL4754383.1 tyrosine-type recombinase/integrase [Myxococcales bacterium]
MARPRKGSLYLTKSGFGARYWKIVDGEWIRVSELLETFSKPAARRKLARLVGLANAGTDTTADDAKRADTFAEAVERVNKARKADGVKGAKDELARLRAYANPALGHLDTTTITAQHIHEALDFAKGEGRSRQTVAHLLQDIRNVFAALKREGTIEQNPADDAELPKFASEVRKERAVLTDAELAHYLAWVHPDEAQRLAVLERQTLACVSRMFGGLRTGDLHALRWEAFDSTEGKFTWGWAPRQKTKRPQLLEVPEMLRPILRDWWERAGRPTAGVLFPARRGERAGEGRAKTSHADAFRRDLMRAFGIEVQTVVVTKRSNGRKLTKAVWTRARDEHGAEIPLTLRQRELFEDTDYTLPVDFHSWRRAFSQALADADVTVQQATALAGHSTLEAHARYLANSGKLRKLPEAALPAINVLATPIADNDTQPHGTTRGAGSSLRLLAGFNALGRPSPRCKASALPLSYPPEGEGFVAGKCPPGKAV